MPRKSKTAATPAAQPSPRQTPEQVREEFLARKRIIDGFTIYPLSLAHLWLLEDIQHPFHVGGKPVMEDGQPKRDDKGGIVTERITTLEILEAIYIFHDPKAACDALSKGRESFAAAVRKMAFALEVRTSRKLCQAIGEEMAAARKSPGAA